MCYASDFLHLLLGDKQSLQRGEVSRAVRRPHLMRDVCVQRGIVGPVCALASGYEYPRRVKGETDFETKEKGKEIEWGLEFFPSPKLSHLVFRLLAFTSPATAAA